MQTAIFPKKRGIEPVKTNFSITSTVSMVNSSGTIIPVLSVNQVIKSKIFLCFCYIFLTITRPSYSIYTQVYGSFMRGKPSS